VTDSTELNNYDADVIDIGDQRYLPPECDVSLRRGWFWQPGDEPKSLEHLLAIHDRSIGLGANLLLNIPPDRRGRIDPADLARVHELRDALHARFGNGRSATLTAAAAGIEAELGEALRFDHVEIREDVSAGQRVRAHRVVLADGTVLAAGGTIGVRRLHRLAEPVTADRLRIEIDGEDPVIEAVIVHDAVGAPV